MSDAPRNISIITNYQLDSEVGGVLAVKWRNRN
jgi:hypothetical protein